MCNVSMKKNYMYKLDLAPALADLTVKHLSQSLAQTGFSMLAVQCAGESPNTQVCSLGSQAPPKPTESICI